MEVDFGVSDSQSGTMRVWTVSKATPVENYRLKRTGFHALHVINTSHSAAANQSEELSQKLSNTR